MKQRYRRFNPSLIASELAACTLRDVSATSLENVVDPETILFARKQYEGSIVKKFDFGGDSEALEESCFNDFISRLKKVEDTNYRIRDLRRHPENNLDLFRSFERARTLCSSILHTVDMEEVFARARHSSGASIGVPYSHTHIERKLSWPMSATGLCAKVYDEYLEWDTSYPLLPENGSRYNIIAGSRATTVPKETDKRRFIAIEPTANMFFQQGIMSLMYDRLKEFNLDVTSLPSRHRELAKYASVSGSNATIDLRNASDCVSIELARWILPTYWFELIMLTRSEKIYIPNRDWIDLPMISTMGNATTFPVETIIFYCLAVASLMDVNCSLEKYRASCGEGFHNPGRLISYFSERDSCSVFGDDCIVPTSASSRFCYLLDYAGFEVNTKKSFVVGPFRESCGGDYYRMRNVRPMFIRTPHDDRLSSLAPWLYSTLNLLLQKYKTYFGKLTYLYDKEAIRYIFNVFRQYRLLVRLVPEDMPVDSGLLMNDHERILSHYGVRHTRIHCDLSSGLLHFSYYRFVYRERYTRDDNIRYWVALKYVTTPDSILSRVLVSVRQDTYKLRRIGGYIVAPGRR